MATKKFNFVITEEMVKRAEEYIPLAQKIAFVEVYAGECLKPVKISTQKLQSDALLPLPQLYEEDLLQKQLVLMKAFLEMYFHVEVPSEFSCKEYDKFAKSHPMNQLERLKNLPSIKDKVFNIISDYKELKKLFEIGIYNRKASHNDGIERALAGITVINDPETMKKVIEELKKAQPQLAKKKEEAEQKTGA